MKRFFLCFSVCSVLIAAPDTLTPAKPPVELPSPSEQSVAGPTITDIEIRGNQNVALQIITLNLLSKIGEPITKESVQEDIKNIYKLGYFQAPPRVNTERFGNGIRLVFEVLENPLVDDIIFKGNTLIPTEVIADAITTKPGSVLNIRQLYEDLALISKLYRDKGYIYSGIYNPGKQVQIEGTKISVDIKESVINKILLDGNKKTRDYVIMRELLMEEGQVVSRDQITESLRNLRNLDYFEIDQPDIKLNPDTGDTDITLKLKDIKTGTASFGGGYSSINGFVGFVDATERNFRGKGQTLRVKTQFGGEQAYELGFTEPYWKGRRQAIGGSLFQTIVDRDDIRDQVLVSQFEEKRQGYSLFSSWRKRKDESLTVRFVDEKIETTLISGSPLDLLNDRQQSIGVTWVMDRRDNFQYPTKGWRNSLGFTTTGGILAGVNNYNKYSLDYRYYKPFKFIRRNTFAMRTKLGYAQQIDGIIPYVDLWSVGGSNSVRGYEDREFNGEKMWVTNLELRYKISEQFSAALFSDFGSAWDTLGGFDLKAGYGVGIRFKTPLGPFRLDFAKGDERSGTKIHFGIGTMF